MTQTHKSPAELRSMFGDNLRHLSSTYPSISELSRQLGINRTQFNRYLSGESFPRPDILARICEFFDVDARVLLEPVADMAKTDSALSGSVLGDFLGAEQTVVSETDLPSGFYVFVRRSFIDPNKFARGVVRVWRENKTDTCYLRGFEAREAMHQQGLPMTRDMREFRGICLRLESGIGMMISRRNALTATFNFLNRVASFENNFWVGYVARTVAENMESQCVTRMIYEHVGTRPEDALPHARRSGLVDASDIAAYHRRLLQAEIQFR